MDRYGIVEASHDQQLKLICQCLASFELNKVESSQNLPNIISKISFLNFQIRSKNLKLLNKEKTL